MEKKDNSPAITKSYAKKMETISPFELKNKLIEMADESIKKMAHTMLNAGRGNPNWIVIVLGNAFVCLMEGLIVGIQVLRLEYYEIFSRFYAGNGREFKPFMKAAHKN